MSRLPRIGGSERTQAVDRYRARVRFARGFAWGFFGARRSPVGTVPPVFRR